MDSKQTLIIGLFPPYIDLIYSSVGASGLVYQREYIR